MVSFYKPNKNITGALASFRFLPKQSAKGEQFKEGCVYANLVRQTDWDAQTDKGSFKGGEQATIKFSMIEAGKIINAIQRRNEFSAFHSFDNNSTQILLRPWLKNNKFMGFGLMVKIKQNNHEKKFNIGIGTGEDVVLCEFMRTAIQEMIMARYAEDKRQAKERQKEVEEVVDESIRAAEVEEDDADCPF